MPPQIARNLVVMGSLQRYLAQCESGGKLTAINYKDAKITGYPSYGKYQYQPKTFLSAGKRYGFFPPTYTLEDVMKVIYDEELQDRITRELLLDEEFRHWKICYKKYIR